MDWRPTPSSTQVLDVPAPVDRPDPERGHTDLDAQTQAALQTRMVIGQAAGILMQRDGLSAERAFALLVETSQQTNLKLRDIAQRLVTQVDDQNRSR